MPRINEMIESKFLKKEDVGGERGMLVTIESVGQANVAMQGADPEIKWTLSFTELDKPMVLNSTNIHSCAKACGSDNTDDWTGKKVVLFEDPNVSFGGKIVGGIRIRAPRTQAAPVVPQRRPQVQQPQARVTSTPAVDHNAPPARPGNFADMKDDVPWDL